VNSQAPHHAFRLGYALSGLGSLHPRWLSGGTWLLILLTAWVWLRFFLWQPPDLQPQATVKTAAPSQPVVPGQAKSFSLFGQPGKTAPDNAPVSQLELRLTGTMAGSNPSTGLAFLDNKKGQQKSFAVGDTVFGLAELVEIHPDYVILRRNGREEKLPLATAGQFSHPSAQRKHSSGNRSAIPGIRGSSTSSRPDRAQQNQIDAIRDKYLLDPQEIAKSIQVVPITDGSFSGSGLRVSTLRQGALLQRAGLRSNDLITAINGKAISPANIMNLASELENASQINLTVRRNGRTQNLQLNLDALKQPH